MSQWPFIPYSKNYVETERKVTYFKNDRSVHSHLLASTAQSMDFLIIDMFECIKKRSTYTWDVHVECIETPLDWQMTIDERHVFHSTDFCSRCTRQITKNICTTTLRSTAAQPAKGSEKRRFAHTSSTSAGCNAAMYAANSCYTRAVFESPTDQGGNVSTRVDPDGDFRPCRGNCDF